MRLTVACPKSLIVSANQLAMVLAFGPADGKTYGELKWKDGNGNLYACASFEASPEWIAGAVSKLAKPEWDTENKVNLTSARYVQAKLSVWLGPGDNPEKPIPIPLANTGKLTVVAGADALAALSSMGIKKVS